MDYSTKPGIARILPARAKRLYSFSLAAIAVATLFIGCGKLPPGALLNPPESTATSNYSDYIVVASTLNQAVSLLDPNGNFLREVLVLDGTTTDAPAGIGVFDSENILVSVEGVDRVMKANLTAGPSSASNLILSSQLSGTLANVTRLESGDILVVETSNVERFTSVGTRVTTGSWPKALQTTGSGIEKIAGGGFVHCSTGTDVVRTYTDAGVQIATAASGIGGTTDVRDCAGDNSGKIAAAFNGTTDTIRIYSDSTLATTVCSFSDTSLLADPRALDFRPNGNLLIADGTSNVLIEIDGSCGFVRQISSAALATPVGLKVMP